MAIKRFWDVPLPMQDVQRVEVSGDDDAGMEVEKAAGNPGALGVAPGSAGGGKPGTT